VLLYDPQPPGLQVFFVSIVSIIHISAAIQHEDVIKIRFSLNMSINHLSLAVLHDVVIE